MKNYQEITFRSDTDINQYFLWKKIFQKVHLKFVDLQDDSGMISIGISFPEYKYNNKAVCLGSKLRLFAPDEDILKSFNTQKILNYFSDYIHCTGIREVPKKYDHAIYWRQQPKSSVLRIARRKAKREGLSYKEALEKLKDFDEHRIKAPYINVKSHSSGHQFRLFIIKKIMKSVSVGYFNCYGLSSKSTVPEF